MGLHEDGNEIEKGESDEVKNDIARGLIFGFFERMGVGVGRHGLILEHNEATGSRKVSRHLPDLWDTIFD